MDVHAPVLGLTTTEADAARRRGEANTAVSGTPRTYTTILRTNVFSTPLQRRIEFVVRLVMALFRLLNRVLGLDALP